jgi:hypothetical protein
MLDRAKRWPEPRAPLAAALPGLLVPSSTCVVCLFVLHTCVCVYTLAGLCGMGKVFVDRQMELKE